MIDRLMTVVTIFVFLLLSGVLLWFQQGLRNTPSNPDFGTESYNYGGYYGNPTASPSSSVDEPYVEYAIDFEIQTDPPYYPGDQVELEIQVENESDDESNANNIRVELVPHDDIQILNHPTNVDLIQNDDTGEYDWIIYGLQKNEDIDMEITLKIGDNAPVGQLLKTIRVYEYSLEN